jgi:hypothetical protein
MIQKLISLYETNGYVKSFVTALEMAMVGFVTSYSGGLPSSKTGWATMLSALGGAVWSALRTWLVQNAVKAQVAPKA